MRRVVLVLAAALVLCAPAVAQARMQVGYQSDPQVIDPRTGEQTLDFMRAHGGQWVRLMLQEQQMPVGPRAGDALAKMRAAQFELALRRAHERGLKVLVTMLRWQGVRGGERPSPTAGEWGVFSSWAAARFGRYVDAWAPVNEANHPAFRIASAQTCTMSRRGGTATVVRHGMRYVIRYRKVKPGAGRYRRIVYTIHSKRNGTWQKISYKRSRGRKARYVRIRRRVPFAAQVRVATSYDLRVCSAQQQLDAYRSAYDASAAAIRASYRGQRLVQPLLVAGDFAPRHYWKEVADFFAARRAAPDVDVLGLHAYGDPAAPPVAATTMAGVEYAVQWARKRGMAAWVTEWGCHNPAPAGCWANGARRFERAGIGVVIAYHLYGAGAGATWDTGLLNSNGSVRPAWTEFVGWLAGR